jgi:hypothetical protein
MPIVQTIDNRHELEQAFLGHGRGDQFTPVALEALFDYYEQLSEDTGEPYVLDVVGICCEWCEYDDAADLAEAYDCTPEEMKERTTIIRLEYGDKYGFRGCYGYLLISC